MTSYCGSTAQDSPTVPVTSLPDCPSTDVTSDSTITPYVTITDVFISSDVPISSIKSTNAESMTYSTVMDYSPTGDITAASKTEMTTPNNVGKATELPSTVETTTIVKPIENTVIRTKVKTSTEKNIIDNRTFTMISSVSESFQKTLSVVSEQTPPRNATDSIGESSSSRCKLSLKCFSQAKYEMK